MQKWSSIKLSLFIVILFFSTIIYAENNIDFEKTQVVSQEIQLLQNRLTQFQNQLAQLLNEQKKQLPSIDHANKLLLNQAELDVNIANSNRDSINVELAESQQTIARIEKDIQEINNELNVSNIFGLKFSRNHVPNIENLRKELRVRTNLLTLEKERIDYLQKLQAVSARILQLEKNKFDRIEMRLKSHIMVQLKEQQARSQIGLQQKQAYWLQHLDYLYRELKKININDKSHADKFAKLQSDIFYANENANAMYLQLLVARYHDQLQQMKLSISQTSSINLLSEMSDQTQNLGKQLIHLNELLKGRLAILKQHKDFFPHQSDTPEYQSESENLTILSNQYQDAVHEISVLGQQLNALRGNLDNALQHELSARQGLPGFNVKAWFDLGEEIILVPTLTFKVTENLVYTVATTLRNAAYGWWILLVSLECIGILGFIYLGRFLNKIVTGVPDHEFGHINLKWLLIKTLHRNLIGTAIISNVIGLFYFCNIPYQNFSFITNLGLVWLCFKVFITVSRLCLVETVHDRAGHDVRLFHSLKWAFWVGGLITAFTVFFHQLPVIYELKDLFDRLFLLFLLIVSVFLIKSWEILPSLILPHIHERHTYLRKIVRVFGLLIPFLLLANSAIGLFGYVNLVFTVSWYEGIFLFVLVCYLVLRGVINDGMQYVSEIVIRHVSNGWLWTEAFLKPIDRILKITLFVSAWVLLFIFYGWDQQSPVVDPIKKFIHVKLFYILKTPITLFSILELTLIISLFYWVARWTREFVYRFLLSRTKDLGLRNSMAIFSQYLVIITGILICLRVLGIDFQALTVVAGMFSLGIGLGLRDLANNFVCGFLLLIERPIRVGDIVTINDYEGEVIHIGGRAVTLRTWDHVDVLVPNAEIFSKSFTNWTSKDSVVRSVITIKVNRHDDPAFVQSLIYDVLLDQKDVLKDPPPDIVLKELSDGLLEFDVRYYVNMRQIKSRIGVRSATLIAIWSSFERHGVHPAYPHREIHVKSDVSVAKRASEISTDSL